jgi:TctA family transporter
VYSSEALFDAIGGIFQTKALLLMLGGVVVSSLFAALPGIGSLLFLSMTIPFAMSLEPYECIALLLGIATVSNTANTFSSVLIAVPGGAGSQATILDGYPMAQKGEANRAFGAAFTASALGALFGAIVFTATLPVMRPMVMGFGSPAFLMLVIWGLSAVAVLGGNQPLKGLMACVLGLAITTIGAEQRTGVERFVLEEGDYLSEGIHIIVVALGLFAVPELISLSVRRTSVSQTGELGSGLMQGVRDAFKNWWLVIRCSTIGVWIGVLPGLGSSVADWFAYAHAVQSEKNKENFGKGDVRGVIAPESSNNAKEGGALIPTTFFGIPGSTSFALILVAFIAVGELPLRHDRGAGGRQPICNGHRPGIFQHLLQGLAAALLRDRADDLGAVLGCRLQRIEPSPGPGRVPDVFDDRLFHEALRLAAAAGAGRGGARPPASGLPVADDGSLRVQLGYPPRRVGHLRDHRRDGALPDPPQTQGW